MALFAVGLVGRPPRRCRPQRDRQRLGLRAEHGRVLHRLDLLRQRRPRRQRRRLVPAHLPGAHAGHGAGLAGAAQDGAHRAHLAHHLDRRLHRQPLRQEPAAGRPRHAHRAGGRGALRGAAAQGRRQRLCAAHRHAARRRGRLRHRAADRAGAGRLHHRVRHPPPRQHRAPRGPGGSHRRRVGGQAAGLSGGRRLRHLGALRRPGRTVRARHGHAGDRARCCSRMRRTPSPTTSGSRSCCWPCSASSCCRGSSR